MSGYPHICSEQSLLPSQQGATEQISLSHIVLINPPSVSLMKDFISSKESINSSLFDISFKSSGTVA